VRVEDGGGPVAAVSSSSSSPSRSYCPASAAADVVLIDGWHRPLLLWTATGWGDEPQRRNTAPTAPRESRRRRPATGQDSRAAQASAFCPALRIRGRP
jgi:hypothetical protein